MFLNNRHDTASHLLKYLLITTVLTSIVFSVFNYIITVRYIEDELKKNAELHLNNFSKEIAEPLWNLDEEKINEITKNYIFSSEIISMEIINDFYEVMCDITLTGNTDNFSNHTLSVSYKNNETGLIRYKLSLERVNIAKRSIIISIVVVMMSVIISITTVTISTVRTYVTKPLEKLITGLKHIGDGNYKYTLKSSPRYDINKIISSVNNMTKQIDLRTDLLRKEVDDRIIAENTARESEKNLFITLNSIGDGVIVTDTKSVVTMLNPAAEKMTGWTSEEAAGQKLKNVFNISYLDNNEPVENPVKVILKKGDVINLPSDILLKRRDNTNLHIADSGAPIKNESGEVTGTILVFRDITNEYHLESQLRQSQKMDSLGKLAGGIAHDFNNILGAIKGYNSLLLDELDNESTPHVYSNEINKAVDSASELIRMLLSFSRKKSTIFNDVNLHDILSDTIKLFSRTTSGMILVSENLNAEISFVSGHNSQLQNVFLNLMLNAKDAMNDEGQIHVCTDNVFVKNTEAIQSYMKIEQGHYIRTIISDNGCGMDKQLMDKIFDPFFTTKPEGKGTGLGLATIYGTIKNHNGGLALESIVGRGTSFYIYLQISKEKEQYINTDSEIVISLMK